MPRQLRVEPQDGEAGCVELANYLEVRRAQEEDGEYKHIRRGWCLGSEAFRKELLDHAKTWINDERMTKLKCKPAEQGEFNL